MKLLLTLLFVASLSSLYASYMSNEISQDAPSAAQSAAKNKKPSTQEYIDTARTGQAAPMRFLYKDGRCRDADGVWLNKEDMGYAACVRDAKKVEKK